MARKITQPTGRTHTASNAYSGQDTIKADRTHRTRNGRENVTRAPSSVRAPRTVKMTREPRIKAHAMTEEEYRAKVAR